MRITYFSELNFRKRFIKIATNGIMWLPRANWNSYFIMAAIQISRKYTIIIVATKLKFTIYQSHSYASRPVC